MKLQNKLGHMCGKAVLCGGSKYVIDQQGVAVVDNPDHAKKLLSSKFWHMYREPMKDTEKEDKTPDATNEGASSQDFCDVDVPDVEVPLKDLSKPKLRKLADSHGIEYEPKTTKAELVSLMHGKGLS